MFKSFSRRKKSDYSLIGFALFITGVALCVSVKILAWRPLMRKQAMRVSYSLLSGTRRVIVYFAPLITIC